MGSGEALSWDGSDTGVQAVIDRFDLETIHQLIAELIPNRQVRLRSITQGLSGAAVLLAYPSRMDLELPLPELPGIIKIGPVAQLRAEAENYDRFVAFQLANTTSFPPLTQPKAWSSTGISALYYRRVGDLTLGDYVNEKVLMGQLGTACETLDRLFAVLSPWAENSRRVQKRLTEDGIFSFGPTSPWDTFENWCQRLQDYSATAGLEGFAGIRRLWDPGYLGIEVVTLAIGHGDLNTENVLVDARNDVTMIDFATTGFGHYLRDVATLEAHLVLRTLPKLDQPGDSFDEVIRFYSGHALGGDTPAPYTDATAVLAHVRSHVYQRLLKNPEHASQYAFALLRHAVRIVTRDDPSLATSQRFLAARIALQIASVLQVSQGRLSIVGQTARMTGGVGSAAEGRNANHLQIRTARNFDEFGDNLDRCSAATMVATMNLGLTDRLEHSLRKREQAGLGFWRDLRIAFGDESVLDATVDDLGMIFPTERDASAERRKQAAMERRRLMSWLINRAPEDRWKVYTYADQSTPSGSVFEMPDGDCRALLEIPVLGRGEVDALEVSLRGDSARVFRLAIDQAMTYCQEQHEVVLVGRPDESGFRVSGTRFRRGVLTRSGGTGWLPAVIAVTIRGETGSAKPMLQLNSPVNSTRELGKISHVSGYINQRDWGVTGGDFRVGQVLPEEVALRAVQRELLVDFGITDVQHIRSENVVDFYYPDKENLRFWLYSTLLNDDTLFPPQAQMVSWGIDELLSARLYQVCSSAMSFMNDAREVSGRDRAFALNLIVANFAAHGELAISELLRNGSDPTDAVELIRRIQNEHLITRNIDGRRLSVEGIAGLQYRAFFSHLLPIYRAYGVPGAFKALDDISLSQERSKGVAVLSELYQDEEGLSALRVEL